MGLFRRPIFAGVKDGSTYAGSAVFAGTIDFGL
jgi:hypothetical protein